MATAAGKSGVAVDFMIFSLDIDHISDLKVMNICRCNAASQMTVEICHILEVYRIVFVNDLVVHKMGTFLIVIKKVNTKISDHER